MGPGSAWIAWLNEDYLGGMTNHVSELQLNNSVLRMAEENVISLLLWTTGHQEDFVTDDEYKKPRGFSDVSLLGSQTTNITWKVQGMFNIYI
jgi:Beta-galactosidase jelly roll domain